MPKLSSIRFLPYLLGLVGSTGLKKIGIPIQQIYHLLSFAIYAFLDGFLLFQGTEVIIRKKEKKPDSRLKTRDTRLCLYRLELLLDEPLESRHVIRVVVLEPDHLTQDIDFIYLLLGCLFLQNGSPFVKKRAAGTLRTPIATS